MREIGFVYPWYNNKKLKRNIYIQICMLVHA